MSAKVIPFPSPPAPVSRRLEWFATDTSVLWGIWATYFILRAAALLIDVVPTSDADWYYGQAASLAAGRGYLDQSGQPTAFWPAGWPIILSLAFSQFGTSLTTMGIFNLISSMVIGQLTLSLGRALFGSEAGARAGLLLLAIYPNAIGYVPLALTEVFYTALLMLGCWVLLKRSHPWHLVTAGVLFGIATLVKAQTLVVVPLVFAIAWLREGHIWKRMPRLVGEGMLVLVFAALTVLPWTIRNHQQLGHWVAVSTNGGYTLLTGNHDTATGDYSPDTPIVADLMARKDLDEVERDAEAGRLAAEWIRTYPDRFIALIPQKFLRLWLRDGESEWAYQGGASSYARFELLYRGLRVANQAYYGVLMFGFGIAFIAMVLLRRRKQERWIDWWLLPYGIALYPTAICLVFSGQSRFHYPVMPWVCMSVGWLIIHTLQTKADRANLRPMPISGRA